ncbi:hypothetical protein BKA81DRAFT_25129 [Phyllosticta paracitricarpa]|uniref:Uncharacterized protein n=1 Tax=Phyllosticta paracitricarpa TaxID=2016321 RepID=A0ABR1NJ73_9PEZI
MATHSLSLSLSLTLTLSLSLSRSLARSLALPTARGTAHCAHSPASFGHPQPMNAFLLFPILLFYSRTRLFAFAPPEHSFFFCLLLFALLCFALLCFSNRATVLREAGCPHATSGSGSTSMSLWTARRPLAFRATSLQHLQLFVSEPGISSLSPNALPTSGPEHCSYHGLQNAITSGSVPDECILPVNVSLCPYRQKNLSLFSYRRAASKWLKFQPL